MSLYVNVLYRKLSIGYRNIFMETEWMTVETIFTKHCCYDIIENPCLLSSLYCQYKIVLIVVLLLEQTLLLYYYSPITRNTLSYYWVNDIKMKCFSRHTPKQYLFNFVCWNHENHFYNVRDKNFQTESKQKQFNFK